MDVILRHGKAIAAVLAAVLAAVVPALAVDGPLGLVGWINVLVLAAGAVQVYNAANIPGWPYAKLGAAIVSAAAVALLSGLGDGVLDRTDWIQIFVATLGAFAVYRVPNGTARTSQRGRHARA